MQIAILFIAIGIATWLVTRALMPLFVNTADEENPIRRLVAGIGHVGLASAGWGVVLLVVRLMPQG